MANMNDAHGCEKVLPEKELESGPHPEPIELDDEPDNETIEYTVADLSFVNGLQVTFSYDELAAEYGVSQDGRLGECAPITFGDVNTCLGMYLLLAPYDAPIPEELLGEMKPQGCPMPLPVGLVREAGKSELAVRARAISPTPVVISDLPISSILPSVAFATPPCAQTHFAGSFWHDGPKPGLAAEGYYSSGFFGKARYTESWVRNCVPEEWGSWLWARHRIYYKSWGRYWKQHDKKVRPGRWNASRKGSLIKRWRRVLYHDGWNSSPSNEKLVYYREGGFHQS